MELEGGHAGAESRVVHVVLPAYNEEASLGDLLDMIAETMTAHRISYRVTVVDDGSEDRTGEIAKEAGSRMPLDLLRNDLNQGLGYTIRRGLRAAADSAAAEDRIVTLDADLTQDPAYIPAMLVALDDTPADVVIASRYRHGSGIEGVPARRRLLSYGASFVVALVRPIRGVRDYSCGFRAYRASVIQWGFSTHDDRFVSERGFGCMLEIAERLRGHAVFAEVPFVLRYDEKRKESAIRIWPTIRAYLRVLSRIRREERASARASTGDLSGGAL